MKKCLHISANQFPSLANVNFTKNIWRELSKDFDEYHILARSLHNKFENFKEGKIFLHLVPRLGRRERSFMVSSLYIFFIIKKHKITHLLAQSSILGGFSAALASKIFKIPLMVEVHGEQYFKYFESNELIDKVFSRISKYSFNSAQKVRSLNSLMTVKLNSNGIVNIVEIPNRVDLSIFNKVKEHFQIREPIELVSVGRFVKEKNYLQLIRDLNELQISFHLTLIGGGPLKAEYESYIYEQCISNKINLISWIDQKDLIELLINSDVYIQYSTSEGMPRTILEAMALRIPIISTDAGSITGVLCNDVNAKVIKVDNINELNGAIKELMNDPNLRERLATNAFNLVIEKYEWNNCFNRYRNELSTM